MITSFPPAKSTTNIGGTLKFFFIEVGDILVEPEIYNGKLIGVYTFQEDKVLLTGLFDFETAKLDFMDASGNKGTLTKNIFSASVSGNSSEYDNLMCEMRTKKFIVFIADVDKNVRVLGRTDSGASFEFSYSTNKKRSDSPGYDYKFTCESSCCPPITTQITDIC